MDLMNFFLLFALLVLAILVGFVLVMLRLMRQQELATRGALSDSQAPFRDALAMVARLAQEHRDSLSQSSKELLQMALEEAQRSQMTSLSATESLSKEWMHGLSSLQQQTTKMLGDAITLIGTKDPVAYQMVTGAQRPLYEGPETQPGYTTSDPEGLLQAVQESDERDALIQKLLNGEITDVNMDAAGFGPFNASEPFADS